MRRHFDDTRSAISREVQAARLRAIVLAWSMLTWGGVTRQSAFSEATVEAVFRRALGLGGGDAALMTSGWTKVVAMATALLEGEADRAPHAIWDSRVCSSLVWRLDRMLADLPGTDPGKLFPGSGVVGGRGGTRPRSLMLRWAHPYGRWWGQEAGSVAAVSCLRSVCRAVTSNPVAAPCGCRPHGVPVSTA